MTFGKIQFICQKRTEDFCNEILSYGLSVNQSSLKVVYSPLNGAGKLCITKVLEAKGITDIYPVKEQSEPDGNFPTCPYPNPEDDKAMELGISLSEEVKADIFLATDPDSDRVGVAALKGEKYERLNGNQVGVLLLDYMLRSRKENGTLPEKPIIIKTIVTTEMVEKIAKEYDAEIFALGKNAIRNKIQEIDRAKIVEILLLAFQDKTK